MRTADRQGGIWLTLAAWVVLLFMIAPSLLVIPMSFSGQDFLQFPPASYSLRWYAAYLTDPEWLEPTLFSIEVATYTTLLSLAVGTAAALALVRGRVPMRGAILGLSVAPLIVPTIISAISIYFLLANLHLLGTRAGFVIANTVQALPYVVLIVTAVFQGFDYRLEMAAASLGASQWTRIRRIIVPLTAPAILTAGVFAFLHSFDEVTIAVFISTVNGKTLPMKLYEGVTDSVTPIVAVVSTLLVVVTCAAMIPVDIMRRRVDRQRRRMADLHG